MTKVASFHIEYPRFLDPAGKRPCGYVSVEYLFMGPPLPGKSEIYSFPVPRQKRTTPRLKTRF